MRDRWATVSLFLVVLTVIAFVLVSSVEQGTLSSSNDNAVGTILSVANPITDYALARSPLGSNVNIAWVEYDGNDLWASLHLATVTSDGQIVDKETIPNSSAKDLFPQAAGAWVDDMKVHIVRPDAIPLIVLNVVWGVTLENSSLRQSIVIVLKHEGNWNLSVMPITVDSTDGIAINDYGVMFFLGRNNTDQKKYLYIYDPFSNDIQAIETSLFPLFINQVPPFVDSLNHSIFHSFAIARDSNASRSSLVHVAMDVSGVILVNETVIDGIESEPILVDFQDKDFHLNVIYAKRENNSHVFYHYISSTNLGGGWTSKLMGLNETSQIFYFIKVIQSSSSKDFLVFWGYANNSMGITLVKITSDAEKPLFLTSELGDPYSQIIVFDQENNVHMFSFAEFRLRHVFWNDTDKITTILDHYSFKNIRNLFIRHVMFDDDILFISWMDSKKTLWILTINPLLPEFSLKFANSARTFFDMLSFPLAILVWIIVLRRRKRKETFFRKKNSH